MWFWYYQIQLKYIFEMSISIKKLSDHVLEFTVAENSTTTHTVTVPDQSLLTLAILICQTQLSWKQTNNVNQNNL